MKPLFLFLIFLAVLATGSCTVGPNYGRPPAPEPEKYKELKGWKIATPIDAISRGPWWTVFKDPVLNSLIQQVEVTNQNVIASEAAYRVAQAVVKEAQAGLFPTVTTSYSGVGSHRGSAISGVGSPRTIVTSTLAANAGWDLDVWGRIRRSIESNAAAAQVSAADLASATLSAQSLLAVNYFSLRAADSLQALLYRTTAQYRRTLEITQHQYDAGTVSKADVATARTQVFDTEAQAINVGVERAQFEHAIAALIGRPPADLTIPVGGLGTYLPQIPASVPSRLLERRPDIAAQERLMQQENALIGVAVAAYYPDITLSGEYGVMGTGIVAASLAHEIWSLGASAVQVAFDGGFRSAQVEAARASYDQSVANYRQTVLTAFQQVEDYLAAIRIYAKEAKVQAEAVKSAQEEVNILLNQYTAGTVAFTAVVVAEAMLLSNQQTDLTIRQNRFLSTVNLIESLGGGWDISQVPSIQTLERNNPLISPF